MNSQRAGFTVIELMITVAVIAVLATIAAPSLRDLVKNARMTSLANDFMTDLNIARSEAVKRGVRTAMCTSNNGTNCTGTPWNQGWIIFTDGGPDLPGGVYGQVNSNLKTDANTGTVLLDVILKISRKIDGADENPPTSITAQNPQAGPAGQYIGFRPSGVVSSGGGGPNIEIYICDSRNQADGATAAEASTKGRHITVTGSGRAHAVRCSCTTRTFCNP